MIITLETPKTIITQPAVAELTETFSELTLVYTIDDGKSVKAFITYNGIDNTLTLWEGAEYTAIGDWTQEQANTKIIELL